MSCDHLIGARESFACNNVPTVSWIKKSRFIRNYQEADTGWSYYFNWCPLCGERADWEALRVARDEHGIEVEAMRAKAAKNLPRYDGLQPSG